MGREGEEGGNRGRQLETSVYISKAELVCQRSSARCTALLMQNRCLPCQSRWLTKHFRLVIVMHSRKLFIFSATCGNVMKNASVDLRVLKKKKKTPASGNTYFVGLFVK